MEYPPTKWIWGSRSMYKEDVQVDTLKILFCCCFLLLFVLLLIIPRPCAAGIKVFPATEWRVSTLEQQGMDAKTISAMVSLAKREGQVSSILLIRNGFIVAEYLRQDINRNTQHNFYSCTKSLTSAVVGIAIDQGWIQSERDPVGIYVPAFHDDLDSRKNQVTIHNLLNMTSGMDWPESTTWGHFFAPMIRSEDWIDFVIQRKMECTPGKRFNYNTGGSHLISYIIQRASGENTFQFAKRILFEPIGMKSIRWPADPQGITFGGAWAEMTTRDAARFGYLYLNQGNWNGQRILSEAWVEKSTKIQSEGYCWNDFVGGNYGYQWWINTYGGYATFYAWGAREQYIFVTPELNLVAVFTGSYSHGDAVRPPELYARYVIPAAK